MAGPQADDAPHILIIDDDDRLRDLIRRFLTMDGFRTTGAANAEEARARLQSLTFDAMVLDVMMPGETGLTFLQKLRVTSDVPVIMLTAMGDVEDRIAGLETGADDYLPKPFEPKELTLRLKALLKRRAPEPQDAEEAAPLHFGALTFDPAREVLADGQGNPIRLTESDTKLLQTLAARIGTPIPRADLAQLAGTGQDRAIDVQVTRLRRKIEADPKDPKYLKTVRGIGYRLMADETPDE